eukprot:4033635-Prymnesium_polylepis.1
MPGSKPAGTTTVKYVPAGDCTVKCMPGPWPGGIVYVSCMLADFATPRLGAVCDGSTHGTCTRTGHASGTRKRHGGATRDR